MMTFVVQNEAEVIQKLADEVSRLAEEAISAHGVFRVGLSGGSVVNFLSQAIQKIDVDFSKWRLFFCDERFVPESDAESTFGTYKRTLLPNTPLKEEQFARINSELPLDDCARAYEKRLLEEFQLEAGCVPEFDLLLLGMGPDGHTCSLFPNHKLLAEKHRLIAPISDSPKPPPTRITMTYPLINNAKCCLFAVCGAGKADMVKRVFVDKEPLPSALVNPKNGDLVLIVDVTAGKSLI